MCSSVSPALDQGGFAKKVPLPGCRVMPVTATGYAGNLATAGTCASSSEATIRQLRCVNGWVSDAPGIHRLQDANGLLGAQLHAAFLLSAEEVQDITGLKLNRLQVDWLQGNE